MGYTIPDAEVATPVYVQTWFHFRLRIRKGGAAVRTAGRGCAAVNAVGGRVNAVLVHVMNATGNTSFGPIGAETETGMEGVVVRIPFGTRFSGASLRANIGTVQFDSGTGLCMWTFGAVPRGKTPSLMSSLTALEEGGGVVCKPQVLLSFRLPGFSVSGVMLDTLELGASERYKYYKGLRCLTKAGVCGVRT